MRLLVEIIAILVTAAAAIEIEIVATEGNVPLAALPLGKCQGDCNRHIDCEGILMCFSRGGATTIPGCEGFAPLDGTDICWDPNDRVPAGVIANVGRNGNPPQLFPLQRCHGSCTSDDDCEAGLVCFFRNAIINYVPGCEGEPRPDGADYCVDPQDLGDSVSIPAPRSVVVPAPVQAPVVTVVASPVDSGTGAPVVSTDPLSPVTEAPSVTLVEPETSNPVATGPSPEVTPTGFPNSSPEAVDMIETPATVPPLVTVPAFPTSSPVEPSSTGASTAVPSLIPAETSSTGSPVELPAIDSPGSPSTNETKTPTAPTVGSTGSPTGAPVSNTTMTPSVAPVAKDTMLPTMSPVLDPTAIPTLVPVSNPTSSPTVSASTGSPEVEIPPESEIASLPDDFLMIAYNSGGPVASLPLPNCQGNCNTDSDCEGDLVCFQRTKDEPVPGCVGFALDFFDYCVQPDASVVVTEASNIMPPEGLLSMVFSDGSDPTVLPLQRCHGDCDIDEDCADGLVCFFRTQEEVPGCEGVAVDYTDYCIPGDKDTPLQVEKPTSTSAASLDGNSIILGLGFMLGFMLW